MHKTISCMAIAGLLAAAPAQALKTDTEDSVASDAETAQTADVSERQDAALDSAAMPGGAQRTATGDLPDTAEQNATVSDAKLVAEQQGLAPQADKKEVRQLFCTKERVVGSRLPRKRCRTQAQIDREAQLGAVRVDGSRQRIERTQPRIPRPPPDKFK